MRPWQQRLRAKNEYLKLASLGFGRRATPAHKTQAVQKLRQKHSLKILEPNCPFVLYVGPNKKLVKRKEFEEFIRTSFVV